MNYKIKYIFFIMNLITISFLISQLYNFDITEKKNSNNLKIEFFKFNIILGSIILINLQFLVLIRK